MAAFKTLPLSALLCSFLLLLACNAPRAVSAQSAIVTEPDRVVSPVSPAKTLRLSGNLPAWALPRRVSGSPSPSTRLDHLAVLLNRSPQREQAFHKFLDDQQDPSSSQYHHWLTPGQIGEQYGLTTNDLAQVKSWLASRGLQVESVSKSRTVITFNGTVAALESALSLKFHSYDLPLNEAAKGSSTRRLSIDAEPRIPLALAPVIRSFSGLAQIPIHAYSQAKVKPLVATPQYSNCSSSGDCQHFLTPDDFETIFNTPSLAGLPGGGQRIAIIGRSRVDPDDLNGFIEHTGISPLNDDPNVLIPPDGFEPGTTNDGDQLEATIDVIRAMGTAPGAAVDLVISASSQTQDGIYIASLYAVDTVLDPVMNISFGACEADAGSSGVSLWDNLASQAAAEGMSIFVSSGDAGAAGCDQNNATPGVNQTRSPNYICSSTYLTCVGGTEFNDSANPATYWSTTNSDGQGSALSYIPEGGWNEPTTVDSSGNTIYQASASGGGVSSVIAKPSWQKGPGVPGDGFRDTPDLAFPSSAHDGYFACLAFIGADCGNGYFAYVYGTSAAAPAMAAITAILNSQRFYSAGNLNPTLYSLAAADSGNAFHDTTVSTSGVTGCSLNTPSMCNNSTPSPSALTGGLAGYQITDGYDQVTGLGSLDVGNFLTAASPVRPVPTVTAGSASITATTNQQFTLKATVAGNGPIPTGTISWDTQQSFPVATNIPLVNGVAVISGAQLPTPGDYNVYVNYYGDANYQNAGTQIAIHITDLPNLAAPSIQLVANPSNPIVGQPVTLTATVTGSAGTPTGTVNFLAAGSSQNTSTPVPLVNGTATSQPQTFIAPGYYAPQVLYSGDSQYQAALSAGIDFGIFPSLPPAFQISASPLTLTPGQASGNTAAITINSQGYNDTISLACKVTYLGQGSASNPPTCSLNQQQLTLNPTTASGTVTATITTIATNGGAKIAGASSSSDRPAGSPFSQGALALAGMLGLALYKPLRRLNKGGIWNAALFLGLFVSGLLGATIGCGGGSSSSTPPPISGTTAGAYALTIIGSSRTYTTAASFSLTIN